MRPTARKNTRDHRKGSSIMTTFQSTSPERLVPNSIDTWDDGGLDINDPEFTTAYVLAYDTDTTNPLLDVNDFLSIGVINRDSMMRDLVRDREALEVGDDRTIPDTCAEYWNEHDMDTGDDNVDTIANILKMMPEYDPDNADTPSIYAIKSYESNIGWACVAAIDHDPNQTPEQEKRFIIGYINDTEQYLEGNVYAIHVFDKHVWHDDDGNTMISWDEDTDRSIHDIIFADNDTSDWHEIAKEL